MRTDTDTLPPREQVRFEHIKPEAVTDDMLEKKYPIVRGCGPDRLGFYNSMAQRQVIRFLLDLGNGKALNLPRMIVDVVEMEWVPDQRVYFEAHQKPNIPGEMVFHIEGTYSTKFKNGEVKLFKDRPTDIGDFVSPHYQSHDSHANGDPE